VINLTSEWRQCWRWLQVQLVAIITIAPELYHQVEAMQSFIEPATFRHGMAALGVLVIVNSIRKKTADK
jgi:hypothetical protein